MTNSDTLPFTPVVIIGAGRSGTNALRDALTKMPDFATWSCDEINPIWRHGNLDWPNDEIPPSRATPRVKRYIREAFKRVWRQQGKPNFIVEKTCANTLRVPFVDAVLPEARYIHIVRNGIDVIPSAKKRWRGQLEMPGLPYYLAKARYAPIRDLPKYAVSAIKNQMAIKFGKTEHFDSWGPRFAGIEALTDATIDEIVARQWAKCVMASDIAFDQIVPPNRKFDLRYEDFTTDAAKSLIQVFDWLEIPQAGDYIEEAASIVRRRPARKSTQALSKTIWTVIEQPMRAHGYWIEEN